MAAVEVGWATSLSAGLISVETDRSSKPSTRGAPSVRTASRSPPSMTASTGACVLLVQSVRPSMACTSTVSPTADDLGPGGTSNAYSESVKARWIGYWAPLSEPASRAPLATRRGLPPLRSSRQTLQLIEPVWLPQAAPWEVGPPGEVSTYANSCPTAAI